MKLKTIFAGAMVGSLLACSGGGDKKMEVKSQESNEVVEEAKKEEPVDPMSNKGIGPISSVELADLDDAMVAEGQELFKAKCSACHKINKRYIGPGMEGITARRTPEWIMNMILNPEEMVSKDPIAKQLLMEYNSPMANQSLEEEEARKILEYFRTI